MRALPVDFRAVAVEYVVSLAVKEGISPLRLKALVRCASHKPLHPALGPSIALLAPLGLLSPNLARQSV